MKDIVIGLKLLEATNIVTKVQAVCKVLKMALVARRNVVEFYHSVSVTAVIYYYLQAAVQRKQ